MAKAVINADTQEAYDYTKADLEASVSCPQCRAMGILERIPNDCPYSFGQRLAAYEVMSCPHECGKNPITTNCSGVTCCQQRTTEVVAIIQDEVTQYVTGGCAGHHRKELKLLRRILEGIKQKFGVAHELHDKRWSGKGWI